MDKFKELEREARRMDLEINKVKSKYIITRKDDCLEGG